MRIEGDWIGSKGVQTVLRLLTDSGHQGYLVGGCVRDALLGAAVSDIDIATDAVPERVIELAKAAGLKVVPTGIEHGTVTIVVDGAPHEVTTFRRDIQSHGRHATVVFSARIEDDAARRDFTMNALYAGADGRILDPLGGLEDLQARYVRFVGDPGQRIREDFLRILRFFRFHAWYGDPAKGIDRDALDACASNATGLDALSLERITHEMRRLLAASDPAPSVAGMRATGVLGRVLPGADDTALAPLVHLEPPYAPRWVRRLAALCGTEALGRLRMTRSEARQFRVLREGVASSCGLSELAYRHGAEVARDAALLRAAFATAPLPAGWEDQIALGAGASFPIHAADLAGEVQGAALGRRLHAIEARWIASGFTLSREQLLA